MPVRPRHCNGHLTQTRNATDCRSSREGESRGPEPGDDSRPRHFRRTSGEVLVAVRRRFDACSLRAFLREECPFLIFNRRSSRFLIACALAIAACEKPHTDPATVTDDFGDPVRLGAAPTRIVSLN